MPNFIFVILCSLPSKWPHKLQAHKTCSTLGRSTYLPGILLKRNTLHPLLHPPQPDPRMQASRGFPSLLGHGEGGHMLPPPPLQPLVSSVEAGWVLTSLLWLLAFENEADGSDAQAIGRQNWMHI